MSSVVKYSRSPRLRVSAVRFAFSDLGDVGDDARCRRPQGGTPPWHHENKGLSSRHPGVKRSCAAQNRGATTCHGERSAAVARVEPTRLRSFQTRLHKARNATTETSGCGDLNLLAWPASYNIAKRRRKANTNPRAASRAFRICAVVAPQRGLSESTSRRHNLISHSP